MTRAGAGAARTAPVFLSLDCPGVRGPKPRDRQVRQSIALKLKAAPSLIPDGHRLVTVLVRV